jgi:hypothetical protein
VATFTHFLFCLIVFAQSAFHLCDECQTAAYCRPACQVADWPKHKAQCTGDKGKSQSEADLLCKQLVQAVGTNPSLNQELSRQACLVLPGCGVDGLGKRMIQIHFPSLDSLRKFMCGETREYETKVWPKAEVERLAATDVMFKSAAFCTLPIRLPLKLCFGDRAWVAPLNQCTADEMVRDRIAVCFLLCRLNGCAFASKVVSVDVHNAGTGSRVTGIFSKRKAT